MYEQEDTSWSFAIGLFVGAIIGAAVASLFTPRSGPQNRELVLEKGLVLKDRVSDATSSVATSVKETTSSAVTSVKETTSSAVTSVKDVASTAAEKVGDVTSTVKDAASSAAEKVSDVTSTTVEKLQVAASSAAEKVGDVTSTVKDAASSAAEKVSDVTSTAADKARELTGRAQPHDGIDLPSATDLVSEASYDAEDARPVTTTAPTSAITSTPSVGLTPTTTEEETTYAATATIDSPLMTPAAKAAASELASPEQFEVTDTESSATPSETSVKTVAGTDTDRREATDGADRSG